MNSLNSDKKIIIINMLQKYPLYGTLFSLVAALSGCAAVGPDYRSPEPAAPAQWRNATLWKNSAQLPDAGRKTDPARWWQAFDDLQLDRLIELALAQNHDLKSAAAKLREARARANLADAALYPQLDASAGARRSESGGNGKPNYSHSAGFDASWEIDLFGGNRRATEAAAATAQASEASLRDVEVSLVAEVANAYISLRTLEARRAVAAGNLASQQQTRDLTRWRWQAGLVSELDFIQSDSTLAQTRAKLPAFDSQIEEARNTLAILLGIPPAGLPDLSASAGRIPVYSGVANLRIPLDTLRQRPDLRTAERKLAAQTAQVGVATAARYPSLNLSGSIGFQADDAGRLLRADSLLNSLAANLAAPVFDAGKIRANIAIQNALLDQALASYEKTVLQALADVENALMVLTKTAAREADLEAANASAQSADQLARQRYAAGLADHLAVLEAERTLLSVQDSLKSVEGERASALVQLYKAMGGSPATGENEK